MSDVSTTTSSIGISSISQTLTTPPPASSSGDDGNENSMSGPSASLYLYTFLATLILLLCISSAIVLRTLVLRRRHRHLVEEAIRNGTLIPFSPSARDTFVVDERSGGKKIDPSQKPKMWEAVMEERDVEVKGEMDQWDWDLIKPLSVTAVGNFVSESVDVACPRSGLGTGMTGSTLDDQLTFTTQRVLRLFDETAPLPLSPLPAPALPNTNTDSSPEVDEAGLRSRPHKVRAAVLIAMPSRSTSQSRPRRNVAMRNLTSSSSPTGSPLPPATEPPPLGLPQVVDEKETEQLPYLEFGIVDLEVR